MRMEAILASIGYAMVCGGAWLLASPGVALVIGGGMLLVAALGRVKVR